MKKIILILTMASFGSFISAQNNPQVPTEKPKTEKGAEKKTTQNEAPAPGTPNQPSENSQNLSDGTKKATITKSSETKKEKGNN
jgi:hypothetical protein